MFFLMASCCSGWKRRPKPRELYDAIRTEKPTNRDRSLIRFWTTEPTPFDLITAWAEGVYTLRQLVGAMHRTGNTTTCCARFLNRLAAHPEMRRSPVEVRRNAGPVTALFQRVKPSRTDTVDDVFSCQRLIAACQRVNFWKVPVDRHAAVGARHAARFDVIFESPDADGWPSGDYSLLIRGKPGVVRVPLQFV